VRGDVFKNVNMDIYLIVQWFKRRWAKPEETGNGTGTEDSAVPDEIQAEPEAADSTGKTEDTGEEKPSGESSPE